MKKLSCKEAREIDLVNYLASLGHIPRKFNGPDYWYLSPLRDEKTPSFKVNRQKGVWYDHGTGQGGDLIDFGARYFKCSVKEFLERLSEGNLKPNFSFHQRDLSNTTPNSDAGEKEKDGGGKIIIVATRPLADPRLLDYLESRCIPLEIAARYCKEVDFAINEKQQTAIGFANDAGGFELRNKYFKGGSSPKSPTTLDSGSNRITVFEGFFDFLSYQVDTQGNPPAKTSFLILNSLAFFNKSKVAMEKYEQVNLYLDRNEAGIECTSRALEWDKTKYIDRSHLYWNGQDLNEWLIEKKSPTQIKMLEKRDRPKHHRGRGPGL
jgi:hypothetical protein